MLKGGERGISELVKHACCMLLRRTRPIASRWQSDQAGVSWRRVAEASQPARAAAGRAWLPGPDMLLGAFGDDEGPTRPDETGLDEVSLRGEGGGSPLHPNQLSYVVVLAEKRVRGCLFQGGQGLQRPAVGAPKPAQAHTNL